MNINIWLYIFPKLTPTHKVYIRNMALFNLGSGSIMMLVIGAIWAKNDVPICGISQNSAKFSIYISENKETRILSGNLCPGYDWHGQKSPYDAGEHVFKAILPAKPKIAVQETYVGINNSIGFVYGKIGYAINGVPIYSAATKSGEDAVKEQGSYFDACAGHNDPYNKFTFSAKIPGFYHYHSMPGDMDPRGHDNKKSTNNIKYCDGIKNHVYKETGSASHSPLVGFMADGIPIYGPQGIGGVPPSDLDKCGGHSGDSLPFYHYHFKTVYPYSVECLVGCVNGEVNSQLSGGPCITGNKTQYDYSSLEKFLVTYGGDGKNTEIWTGPACLLAFGFLIFIIFAGWMFCVCCDKSAIFNSTHRRDYRAQDYDNKQGKEENIEDDYQFI